MSRAAFASVVVGGNVAFVGLAVALGWPEWWAHVNYERSALTWFSTVQLLGIAFLARNTFPAVAAAFVFFAVDERLQIHERLRDHVFKPYGIGVGIPHVGDGDFLFLIFAFVGVVVAAWLWKRLDGFERVALAAGVVLAAVAVVMDAAPIDTTAVARVRREQFFEEIFETAAQACFAICFGARAWRRSS